MQVKFWPPSVAYEKHSISESYCYIIITEENHIVQPKVGACQRTKSTEVFGLLS